MEARYNYVSPGIQINEIDNSGRPKTGPEVGPVVIGRASRGPGMRPVTIESFDKYVEIFGNPVPGGIGGDVWRNGNETSPMYGTYAAQAWLKNSSPLTYVRLLGEQHANCTAAGKAGWITTNSLSTVDLTSGGAFGLFVIDSGSATAPVTGTLAAIFYVDQGSITLSGTYKEGDLIGNTGSTCALYGSIGSNQEFVAEIRDQAGNITKKTNFNFDTTSSKYIRKVFNTNPTVVNSTTQTAANVQKYWLGETFERSLASVCVSSSAGKNYGIILGLQSGTTGPCNDFQYSAQPCKSGWFIAQDTSTITSGTANSYNPEAMTRLFRFHGIDSGEWEQKNLKISIEDIKAAVNANLSYGSFTVTVRQVSDTDSAPIILERFTGVNLDPSSENYIAKRIGDMYTIWDATNKVLKEYGLYPNNSRYFRIEMNSIIENGSANAALLPFGVYGPPRYTGFSLFSGSAASNIYTLNSDFAAPTAHTNSVIRAGDAIARANNQLGDASAFKVALGYAAGGYRYTGSFVFPALPLRTTTNDGYLSSPTKAYFGMDTSKSSANKFDETYVDYVRSKPAAFDSYDANGYATEPSWVFSLDDVRSIDDGNVIYQSGSRALGYSLTIVSGGYAGVLDAGFDKFTAPLFGGFDGFDVTESDPLRNTYLTSGTETTNYAYNTIKKAVDIVADSEMFGMNLCTIPGITNSSLTSYVIQTCENRRDCLGIVDVAGGYQPAAEASTDETSRIGSYATVVTNMKTRSENSSYGCCYHPWVKARDVISNKDLWVPPSVVALGVMAYTENVAEEWFAPAGFNRGGLSNGNGGLPVTAVREKLKKLHSDKLYEVNVNPIINLPNNKIVVYGQKTLYAEDSALNRINVRRLVITVKKRLADIMQNFVFEQNVKSTWTILKCQVDAMLESIAARFGISQYKFILDESTTTPEMIDRNVLYAKLYITPTRTIEKIVVDMMLSATGAAFAD